MQARRTETAPAWLVALAAAALAMSWGVTRQWAAAPRSAARIDQPRRITAPLRWPIAELAPLPPAATPRLDEASFSVRLLGSGVVVELPRLGEPRVGHAPPVVVLLPSEPRWRAGDRGRAVVSMAIRRAWAVGPIDSLAAAERLGVWVGRGTPLRVVSAAPAAATASSRWRPLAGRVVPAERSRAFSMPTIREYLGRSDESGAFPLAADLGRQLDRVAQSPRLAPWAWAVAYRLRSLAATHVDGLEAHRALALLADAIDEALAQSETLDDAAAATELRRAAHGVQRRVSTWRAEQAYTIVLRDVPPADDPLKGARWAMSSDGLGIAPGALLAEPEIDAPLTLKVARRVEEFEAAPSPRLARHLAIDAARLAESPEAEARAMAQALEDSYRNANLRIAIAAELIERALPQPEPVVAVVRDRIAGAPVRGRSTTTSRLALRLVEDASAWRMGIEATGTVTAETVSRGGPASLRSRGTTGFEAKKLVVLTPEGLRGAPAVARAQVASQRLVALSTEYDRVPLLGDYVRSAARSEYGRLRGRVQAETRAKVERQVTRAFDEQLAERLAAAERRYRDEVLARAEALGLAVEPVELRTTSTRLVTRLRVAGPEQLAAHTPRMRAPSDSLLSVQLHESTLNNAISGLGLAGATVTPAELRARLVERLRLETAGEVVAEHAVLRFAAEEPVRFRLADGRAQLTLAIDEIVVRGRRHGDFKVHAFYRPEVAGLEAALVQEGTPHIEGRMRNGARLHLHGVMGKVLGESRRVVLVRADGRSPERLAAALAGLATNQLVIEDGWLGLAIGPTRPAGGVAAQVGGYVR